MKILVAGCAFGAMMLFTAAVSAAEQTVAEVSSAGSAPTEIVLVEQKQTPDASVGVGPGGKTVGNKADAAQSDQPPIPFSELPTREKIKRIVGFTVFCIVLGLYLLRNKIDAWVAGAPAWVRVIWRTLCAIGRYLLRPILIMMKWMILLPLLIMCKVFKLGSKAAWISAKLTGKAALTVAKEVKITGGVFGGPGDGTSGVSSYEREARREAKREAERQRKEEAERQEKADKTPMSATVNNNGQVIAKNRNGKILFGVNPNGKNATAYCSDGCLIVNSTAGNGTRYVQVWDMNGRLIRTEAQPKGS